MWYYGKCQSTNTKKTDFFVDEIFSLDAGLKTLCPFFVLKSEGEMCL